MLAVGVPDILSPSPHKPSNARVGPPIISDPERILAVSASFRGLRLACVTDQSLSIFGGAATEICLACVALPPELAVTRVATTVAPAAPMRMECCWKQSSDALVICRPDTGAVGFFSLRPTDVPTLNMRMADWNADPAELLPQESALHVTYLGGIRGASAAVDAAADPESETSGAVPHPQRQQQKQQQSHKYRCISVTNGRGAVLFGTACGLLLSVSWQHHGILGAMGLENFHPSLGTEIEIETETQIETETASSNTPASPRSIPSPPSPLVLCDLSSGSRAHPWCCVLGFVCSNGNAGVVQLPPISSPLWSIRPHRSDKQCHHFSGKQERAPLWCVLIPSSRIVSVCLSPTEPLLALARDDARVDIFRFTPPHAKHGTETQFDKNDASSTTGMDDVFLAPGVHLASAPVVPTKPSSNDHSHSSGATASAATLMDVDLVSSLSLRPWDIHPGVSGAVTDMSWSWRPDDCLAVLYEHIGHMVWTVDGACRLSSFAPSVVVSNNADGYRSMKDIADNVSTYGGAEFTALAWSAYGYQLTVARNCQCERESGSGSRDGPIEVSSAATVGHGEQRGASSGGDSCNLNATPHMLCYSIVKACESMSLRRNGPERMCLVGAKHVLLLSTPPWDNHELRWQTLEPPHVYIENNGPLLSVAFSDDCSQLALAGKTGLALFSLQTRYVIMDQWDVCLLLVVRFIYSLSH
jgi:hypothetical protein